MLAFHRFLFSTFLFLALCCFGVSSAFSDTTYTYWGNYGSTMCSQSLPALCSSAYGNVKTTIRDCTTNTVECKDEPQGHLYLNNTCLVRDQWGTLTGSSTQYLDVLYNVTYYSKRTHTCPTGKTFKLEGCTATCVDDPCAALEGVEEEALVTCGVASCPSPESFEYNGSTVGCSGGAKTQFIPSPVTATVINTCAHTIKAGQALPTTAKVKTTASGSTTQAFCYATYVNDGISSPDISPISDVVSLSFGGVTPTTENGQCPDGTVKGQMNGQWVCVADSNAGEGSGCPTGQIRNNSGECVPFSEAGTGGTGDGTGGTGDGTGGTGDGDGDGGGGGGTDDGTYTGSNKCDSAPACSGDVVLCGLMSEQHKAKCQMLDAITGMPEGLPESLSKIGTASGDSRVTAANSAASSTLDQLSQKIGFANTACPADISIQVLSKSIVIPISQTCDLLRLIRLFLHLATYFFCLRMLWSTVATV